MDFQTAFHLDTKWSYIVCKGEKAWISPKDEHGLAPKAQNKAFVFEIMFLGRKGSSCYQLNSPSFDGVVGSGDLSEDIWHSKDERTELMEQLNLLQ